MKILVKLSGKVIETPELRRNFSLQVEELVKRGDKIILVHGAGRQLSEYCRQQDIPVVHQSGRRVTDGATLEAAVKVFSKVNREITAALLSDGVNALGFSGFDGNLTQSRKRPPIPVLAGEEKIDFGHVAEIEKVDPFLVEVLWKAGITPVVSSLCSDPQGHLLNINADTLAAELATALSVNALMSVSDVEGVLMDREDPDSLLAVLNLEQAKRYLEDGVFSDGMIPKIENAIRAVEGGIPGYHLVSGLSEGRLLKALDGRSGTVLRGTIGN